MSAPCSSRIGGAQAGTKRGGIIFGLFGIGVAIPLVAVANASRGSIHAARGWVLQRIDGIRKAFGIFILLTGFAILPDAWIGATTLF
jgi:cytochrome c biogenesis protein CcdA